MTSEIHVNTAALDALLAPHDRTDAPGFAVGVARGGRPLYRRGVGLASVELPVTLSPTIRMRIGSTTKHFTCLAIMLLAEQGKLSPDDSPRRFLPELPDWAERMTLRQLMAHTSGMRDSLDLILHASGPGRAAAPDMQFRLLAGLDSVNAAPGETWNYNNGGYILLGAIIERVGGRPLAEFFRERIFVPIGMHDTILRALDTDLVPNSATLHVPAPGGGWTRGVFGTPIGGEGGIASTVDDMLRWLRHMSAPVIGTAETWAAMRTPLTTHGYGLGLSMGRYKGLSTVHHGGTVVGGASQMLKVLEHDLDIAIMSNGHSSLVVHGLSDAIVDACIPGLKPDAAEAKDGLVARGTFYSPQSGRVLALVEMVGGQALDFGSMTLPAGRDTTGALSVSLSLFSTASDLRVRTVGDGDAPTALDITEYGGHDRLERIEAPADAASAAISGRYECREAGMTATIAAPAAEGVIDMHVTGELGDMDYRLQPLGPDLWRGKATSTLPLTVTLECDADGFRLSTGRTQRLRFRQAA